MIIKSLSRATKSFEALYNYLTRDTESILNTFNLYSNAYEKNRVIKEFLENAKFIKNARGKNYLYHEIISLNKNKLSLQEQQDILIDIVNKYISLRAQNHLTFTALHFDKEHLHIHLMISANELEGTKRVRLSKKDFSTIQKELEQYVNSAYPQLGATKHYNKDLKQIKSKKEQLKDYLIDLFNNSKTKDEFKKSIEILEIEFYTRGKTVGVIFNGKKYRLKTLGVLQEYEDLVKKLDQNRETTTKKEKKDDKKVDSNKNETKISTRREEMKKIREDKYSEARSKQ